MNTRIPSGTPVTVLLDDGQFWDTFTRSEPWQLGHGAWVVALEGKAGGYDLTRVTPKEPIPDAELEARFTEWFVGIADRPPVGISLKPAEIWILCSYVQLACRHPNTRGSAARQIAEIVTLRLIRQIGDDPAARQFFERGWDPRYDVNPEARP